LEGYNIAEIKGIKIGGGVQIIPLIDIQGTMLDRMESRDDTGVADAVDIMLSQAVYHGSSDVHLEPWSDYLSLRYRLDGILQQIAVIPSEFQPKIIARIKVLSDLVVYRKDVPQDGRIDREKCSCGRPMRVSTIPTIHGEKIVVRILGAAKDLYHLDMLGFPERIADSIRALVTRPQGTLLLTGPSSSGKTTTIYAALHEMMQMQHNTINVVSIEDPVEYAMDRISQIQVNHHVEFTFAKALRSILRQDPEVIVVGEIRDLETAKMAIQAGLTGHLVISTIHSGTAAGVFTRLIDMDIEPFLIASVLLATFAQRLVRTICPYCKEKYQPPKVALAAVGLDNVDNGSFMRGRGCNQCMNTGYKGRTGIFEVLVNDEMVQRLILEKRSAQEIAREAKNAGKLRTLQEDAAAKVLRGITTLEEAAGAVMM